MKLWKRAIDPTFKDRAWWQIIAQKLFEFSLLGYFPTLIFSRGFNARCVEIGLLAWLACHIFGNERKSPWDKKSIYLLLFFSFSYGVSVVYSFDPSFSASGFLSLFYCFLFFLVIKDAPRERAFWNRMGLVLLFTTGLLGLDVFTQWYHGTGIISGRSLLAPSQWTSRVRGPFSNPNELVIIPVLLNAILADWKNGRP